MKRPTPTEQLNTLRANLTHFDQSPDFGDAEVVAAIRGHLLVRIREAERLVSLTEWERAQAEMEAA